MLLPLLQLASSLAWNVCFFKLRSPSLALKCVSLFAGLLCATTITFHWVLPSSAVLLLPVLAWAVLLFAWNHSVWRNNRVGKPNATLRTLVQQVQARQADMGEGQQDCLSGWLSGCLSGCLSVWSAVYLSGCLHVWDPDETGRHAPSHLTSRTMQFRCCAHLLLFPSDMMTHFDSQVARLMFIFVHVYMYVCMSVQSMNM